MPPAKKPATRSTSRSAGRTTSRSSSSPSTSRNSSARAMTRKEVERATARFEKTLEQAGTALQAMGAGLGKNVPGTGMNGRQCKAREAALRELGWTGGGGPGTRWHPPEKREEEMEVDFPQVGDVCLGWRGEGSDYIGSGRCGLERCGAVIRKGGNPVAASPTKAEQNLHGVDT